MKKLIISMLLIMPLCFVIAEEDINSVTSISKARIDNVVKLLRGNKVDKQTRNKKVIEMVEKAFDFNQMAKLSLGKKYWKQMNKDQRKEFIKLFVKRLKDSYLEKLDMYSNEDIIVQPAKQVKKNRMEILTYLVGEDNKREMNYKFYRSKEGWQVYDVVIFGVSVVQANRSQIAGFLKERSIEDLLERMRTLGEL